MNGIYSGAAALRTLSKQQETISNNLMHANTGGHHRVQVGVSQMSFEEAVEPTPEIREKSTSFEPGRQELTERPLDLALTGNGFFVFDANGTEFFSRDGRLYRDPDTNQLVNGEGYPIQGDGGSITVDASVPDRAISVATDGTISAEGRSIGKIQTVSFDDPQKLQSRGGTGFIAGAGTARSTEDVGIAQFHRELSNVRPVSELVNLIINNRRYEGVQKAIRTLSESLREYIRS